MFCKNMIGLKKFIIIKKLNKKTNKKQKYGKNSDMALVVSHSNKTILGSAGNTALAQKYL